MISHPVDPHHAVRSSAQVVARNSQGGLEDSGKVIAYADQPTFVIERPDGTRFSWVAAMVTEAKTGPLNTHTTLRAIHAGHPILNALLEAHAPHDSRDGLECHGCPKNHDRMDGEEYVGWPCPTWTTIADQTEGREVTWTLDP